MKITLLIIAFLLLVFLIQLGIAPAGVARQWREKLEANDSLYMQNYDPGYEIPEVEALARKKAFVEAQLELAEDDSIHLIVNLRDSAIHLAIHGVTIHTSKLPAIENDALLKSIPNKLYLGLFSDPVAITSIQSTIVKEPIVERQAPKDPVEAALNAYEPDTLIQNPAYIRLRLVHGIDLVLEQHSNPSFAEQWTRFRFRQESRPTVGSRVRRMISFRGQEYTPTIRLKLPANDIRALYRALPAQPKVVLYY
ncbi:MAG: hypothetical protein RIC30_07885 [Marinoscillum sp.]|uniref:hypothetical protein n=1 Tax=Marinoscillum sp. TaxID=2024838 RepID=UPI0033017204